MQISLCISKIFNNSFLDYVQLFYFDRIQRLKMKNPRTVPIILAGTREKAVERLNLERIGGFGKGKILPRIHYQPQINEKV